MLELKHRQKGVSRWEQLKCTGTDMKKNKSKKFFEKILKRTKGKLIS